MTATTPLAGDEVQFPDGSTATIKAYVRSRILGYADSVEPREYHEDEASVPIIGHVVEMAKPCRQEYVTVITRLPSGFWQVANVATASYNAEPAQLAETLRWDGTPADRARFRQLVTPTLLRLFLAGMVVGGVVMYLFCRLGRG